MAVMVLPVEVPMTTLIDALFCLPILVLWFGPALVMVLASMRWWSQGSKALLPAV